MSATPPSRDTPLAVSPKEAARRARAGATAKAETAPAPAAPTQAPAEKTAPKVRGKPFKPGASGNPSGRPKGARNYATKMAEELMADGVRDVVGKVIAAARKGDMVAARMILDRLVPIRRGRPIELPDLPQVTTTTDLLVAHGVIIEAMAAGRITPEEAALVADVLESKRRAIETIEHERRLAVIEQQLQTQRK